MSHFPVLFIFALVHFYKCFELNILSNKLKNVCNQLYFVYCPAAKRKTNGNRDMIWKRQIKISKILEWPRSRKERTIMAKRKRMPCNFLINQMYTKQQQYTLQSGWMKDWSVFFVHKFLLRENLIFVRPFPPRAEDDNVSVPTDAVGLVLTAGLDILVVFLVCRWIFFRSVVWRRRSEEKAT